MKIILPLVLIAVFSCKSRTERWLNAMADFKEVKDKSMTFQAMKIKTAGTDTAELNYKVRIYLTGKQGYDQSLNFYYHMDSCFTLRADGSDQLPVILQPVNNGIRDCYEYLLSFEVNRAVKYKAVQLIYKDRYSDGKQYELNLNK